MHAPEHNHLNTPGSLKHLKSVALGHKGGTGALRHALLNRPGAIAEARAEQPIMDRWRHQAVDDHEIPAQGR
jgi:hypothetical protein